MPKIAAQLSALEVSRLKAPGLVSVGGVPGLSLQISATGARSWILRVKVGSKRRDMGLGPYPGVTLAQAYEKARSARATIEQGEDPILTRERAQSQLRAAQASAITFKQAAERFIDAKAPEWRNPKHRAQWAATLESYAYPVIGNLDVKDVTDNHVLQIIEPIWTTKTETATRVRGRIENVLDWATAKKYRTGENPARWRGHLDKLLSAPKKTTAVVHHEAIPVDAAPEFHAKLKERKGTAARALEFILLTATRSGETRGAVWPEIDLDKGIWTIPANRMKAGREHRVPLTASMVELLQSLPRMEGVELVFPSAKGVRLSDMAITQVMRRMGLTAVPHGLRSTFRDWVAEKTSYPRDLAEKALAHTLTDAVEAAYQRGDMFQKRQKMMESWGQFLATPVVQGSKVVSMSKRAA
jgi:integrase